MMAVPALCTGCSGQLSRISGLFQVFQALQEFLNCSKRFRKDPDGFWVVWTYLGATGCNWRSLDVLGHVLTVPGHLVLGKCWLATPVGAGSVKLTVGQGLI